MKCRERHRFIKLGFPFLYAWFLVANEDIRTAGCGGWVIFMHACNGRPDYKLAFQHHELNS